MLAVVELPAASVPSASIVLPPCVSVTSHWNSEPSIVAATPLQRTAPAPDSASVTVPDTAIAGVRTVPLLGTGPKATTGAFRSILTVAIAVAV